jgi:prolycopene isomerase
MAAFGRGRPASLQLQRRRSRPSTGPVGVAARATKAPYPPLDREIPTEAPEDVLYDAVVVGGGMGGLTTAAKLVEKGAKVLVLEKYLVPGGSAAHFKREGYTFDVGSSMMFGFGDQGTTNLITKALEAVGRRIETVPDPTQVHYHLPKSAAHPEVRASVHVCLASGGP